MKLHYNGKYNLDPDSLPHGEHQPNTHQFKEAENPQALAMIANAIGVIVLIIAFIPAYVKYQGQLFTLQTFVAVYVSLLLLFPHELLHAICFKKDVYLYTLFSKGMLFVIGPETISKSRFIGMSLLPNIVLGLIPYILGMYIWESTFLTVVGILCLSIGGGDYYNVFNAATQMPKGARTYLYKFNSFWYIPA